MNDCRVKPGYSGVDEVLSTTFKFRTVMLDTSILRGKNQYKKKYQRMILAMNSFNQRNKFKMNGRT